MSVIRGKADIQVKEDQELLRTHIFSSGRGDLDLQTICFDDVTFLSLRREKRAFGRKAPPRNWTRRKGLVSSLELDSGGLK